MNDSYHTIVAFIIFIIIVFYLEIQNRKSHNRIKLKIKNLESDVTTHLKKFNCMIGDDNGGGND